MKTNAVVIALLLGSLTPAWADDAKARPDWRKLVLATQGHELALSHDGGYVVTKDGHVVKTGRASPATLATVDGAVVREREFATRPRENRGSLFNVAPYADWILAGAAGPPERPPISKEKFRLSVEAPTGTGLSPNLAKRTDYEGRGYGIDLANSGEAAPVRLPVAALVDALEGVLDEATDGAIHAKAREVTGRIGYQSSTKFGLGGPGVVTVTDDAGQVHEVDPETPFGHELSTRLDWTTAMAGPKEDFEKNILAKVKQFVGGDRVTVRAFVDETTETRDETSARAWSEAKAKAEEDGIPGPVLVKMKLPEPRPLVFKRLQPVRPVALAPTPQERRQPAQRRALLPGENGVAPEEPAQTRGVAPSVTGR